MNWIVERRHRYDIPADQDDTPVAVERFRPYGHVVLVLKPEADWYARNGFEIELDLDNLKMHARNAAQRTTVIAVRPSAGAPIFLSPGVGI